MKVDILILQPIVALAAGIIILLMPSLLNLIVAVHLIVVGITGLWPSLRRRDALCLAYSKM